MQSLTRFLSVVAVVGFVGGASADELPTYHIVAKDGRLNPSRIEIEAGRKTKLTLHNEGPGPLEFESDDPRVEKVLSPGASSFVVLPPLNPGQYEFTDEFNPVTGELVIIAK